MRGVLHGHKLNSSVIINQVDIESVRTFKTEDDAPIRVHRNGPEALPVSLDSVQTISGETHPLRGNRGVEVGENALDLVNETGADASPLSGLEQPLQAAVPEGPYH